MSAAGFSDLSLVRQRSLNSSAALQREAAPIKTSIRSAECRSRATL